MYTVKDVHQDFKSAQDRLIADANRIINSNQNELIKKGERLSALGFTKTKPAKISDEIKVNQNAKKELVERIAHYHQRYPLNRFITEEEVSRLCKKYNLVFSTADRFIGEIPEKNLQEIENFKVDEDDCEKTFNFYTSALESMNWSFNTLTGIFENGGVKALELQEFKKPAFKMVASINDFDTANMELRGHKLELNLPDPIVLQPVKLGYLIVSAWGDEAADVVNEKMN